MLPRMLFSSPELIRGLALGDQVEATRRAYELLRGETRANAQAAVETLRRFLLTPGVPDNHPTLLAGSMLEAINRLDPTLVSIELIEELASSPDFSVRSTAAVLLWDRAEVAPADVPLGILGRLARPADEDWYVQAPAIAAVKLLLLKRRSTRVVLDRLAGSPDPEDRFAVAATLADVAWIDTRAAPRDLAERLAADPDPRVAVRGRTTLAAIPEHADGERDPLSPFGL